MILDTYMNNIDIHPDIKRISESVDSLDYINDPYEYLVSAVYENQLISMQLDTAIMCKEYTYLKENGEELLYEANIFVAIIDAMKKIITSVWNAITSFFKTIFSKSKSEGTERNKQRLEKVEKQKEIMVKENEKRKEQQENNKKDIDGDHIKNFYLHKTPHKMNYRAKGDFEVSQFNMSLPKQMMGSVKDLWENCTFSFNLSDIDLDDLGSSIDKNATYIASEEAYNRQEKFLTDKMIECLRNILKYSEHYNSTNVVLSVDNFVSSLGKYFEPVVSIINELDYDDELEKYKTMINSSYLSYYKDLYNDTQKIMSDWRKRIDQYEKQYKVVTKDSDKIALSLYSKMMQWDRSIVNRATAIIAEVYKLGNKMVEKRIHAQDILLCDLFSAYMGDPNTILQY